MKSKTTRFHWQTLLLIWMIVGAGCLYIFHMYLLGNLTVAYFDFGTDGKDQYMMWYNGIVNSFRNGNFSTWDFRNGFGMNTMGHNLTEPFLIPVFILGVLFGPEKLTHYMVWVEIIRILFSAAACYWFLSEFEFEEKAKLLSTVLYAFNSYMMVWGQHYALGSAVVYFPVILLFVERVLKKRRFGIGLCLICCLTLLSGFYQGYMCMLAGGVYVVVRVIMMEQVSLSERIKVFLLSAGSMILGVCMAAVRFIPSAAAQVGSSARLEPRAPLFERLFVFKVWSGDVLKTILYRLFSSCIQGNGNEAYVGYKNFYEAPELFFSTLFVILLIQFLFLLPRMKESRRKKILQYGIVLLCCASILFMNITTLFNGLYKPFFRHTFVLMPVFAVLCAKVLDYILKEKKVSLIGLIVAALAMTAIYLKAYKIFPEQQFKNNACSLLMTGLFMVVLLFLCCKEKWMDVRTAYALLVVAATVNIVSDSFLCYNYRVTLTKDHPEYYSETYHSDVNGALAWIKEQDQEFYRVEKDYFTASSCLDSLAQDYRCISAYNTNQNANIKEFKAQLWPQLDLEKDIYHMQFQNAIWDTTLAALTDVKYVLSKAENLNLKGYQKVQQVGEVYVYENTLADSLGHFFTKTVSEDQYLKQKEALNERDMLKEVLIVGEEKEPLLSDEQLKTYEKKEIHDILKGNLQETFETADILDLELLLDKEQTALWKDIIFQFTITAEKRTVVNVMIDDGYRHFFVQNSENARDIHIEIPEGAEKVRLSIEQPSGAVSIQNLQFYGTQEEKNFDEKGSVHIQAPDKDSLLTGTVSASEDGYVMLSVPFEKGWKVYLDGEEQEIFPGDFGFIAFDVKEGEHDLRAVFTAPLLREGMLLSIVCVILFLIICAARKHR